MEDTTAATKLQPHCHYETWWEESYHWSAAIDGYRQCRRDRLPDQGEPIDKAFLLQLQEASHLQALILLGNFKHFDIYRKSSTASCRQLRRLLECTEPNFLSHIIDNRNRGEVVLDLMVTNTSELVGDVKIGGSLGCSDHVLLEFSPEGCWSGKE
ncbi:tbc1 domain family member 4-like [Limosa lapponica baueri]|uniref:Tbc1 domain family member 4-like n=1 Tax=Limosa lapponica baueri TaxID=1758121 RepID=A0A2I0UGE2_LIMLA|nr:tbc1 domain family member 4-like [Limosa lapponica baueri]